MAVPGDILGSPLAHSLPLVAGDLARPLAHRGGLVVSAGQFIAHAQALAAAPVRPKRGFARGGKGAAKKTAARRTAAPAAAPARPATVRKTAVKKASAGKPAAKKTAAKKTAVRKIAVRKTMATPTGDGGR